MSEKNQAFNVLFLCTGNSCRSILAEATFNHLAPPGWRAMRAAFDVAMARIGPWSIISLFGFESGAALATVVGVLIEVPVMLVVRVVNSSKGWYERTA